MRIPLASAKIWQSFQVWLLKRRKSWATWFQAGEPEPARGKSWAQLPKSLKSELLKQFSRLSVPEAHLALLQRDFLQLFQAWSDWEEDPKGETWAARKNHNVWVVVGPSAVDLLALLDALLNRVGCSTDRNTDSSTGKNAGPRYVYNNLPVDLIHWPIRPDSREMQTCLQQHLKTVLGHSEDESHAAEALRSDRRILMIPHLEQCFLRSVDGLAGIDYLREQLNNSAQFWMIGVGPVAWSYLQTIGALEDYGDRVTHLPPLSGQQLSQWLSDIVSDLDLDFDSLSLQVSQVDQDLNWQAQYFETLAEASQGVGEVATQLFLDTLEIEQEDPEIVSQRNTEENPDSETSAASIRDKESMGVCAPRPQKVEATLPDSPGFPDLEGELSLYMLYSLLLHQQLTASQLAESLGLNQEQAQSGIQQLTQAGLMQQRGPLLRLNPVYYSAVRSRLKGDKFLL